MNHASLKTQIKIAQTTTHIQRSDATKYLNQGRELRRKARVEPDKTLAAKLMSRGQACHAQGMNLSYNASSGGYGRRVMHLTAALCNGKTYNQCEPKRRDDTPKIRLTDMAMFLREALPLEEQKHAEFIAGKTWADVLEGLREAYQKKQVADAEKALSKAQQNLVAIKGEGRG